MAKSLDDLIEFLLEEIALLGPQGASVSDVTKSVNQFYNQAPSDSRDFADPSSDQHHDAARSARSQRDTAADRPFLSKVWQWLARHRDISAGLNNEFGCLTLDEAENLIASQTSEPDKGLQGRRSGPARDSSAAVSDTALRSSDALNDEAAVLNEEFQNTRNTNLNLRLYACQERIYLALCGHGPDPTRVFPSEFALLSVIASSRHEGILQGRLTQLSGQDKRSVPKRTDALHQKGYVEKRLVWVKGNKTSRLFLRRFAIREAGRKTCSPNTTSPRQSVTNIAVRLVESLEKSLALADDDVAKILNTPGSESRATLSKVVDHFIQVGCVERSKVLFKATTGEEYLKLGLRLLKKPSTNELESLEDNVNSVAIADAQERPDGVAVEVPLPGETYDPSLDTTDLEPENTGQQAEYAGRRILPQWNPDRVITNVLANAVERSGSDGLTNLHARSLVTGAFVRRTLETTLTRISHASPHPSLQSHPSTSIIRSQEWRNGKPQFVYRTLNQSSQASANSGNGKTTGGTTSAKIAGVPEEDKFGFCQRSPPESQMKGGSAAFCETAKACKSADLYVRSGEPVLVDLGQNQLAIGVQELEGTNAFDPNTSPAPVNGTKRMMKKPSNLDDAPKGRPRKFKQGTEKFWRDMFLIAKCQVDPDYLKTTNRAGLMKDPIGQALFAGRPPEFDDVLVRATDHGLPLPCSPEDVGQIWVDKTKAVLDRNQPGLYVTPTGMPQGSRTNRSRILIFRSVRLGQVDFKKKNSPVSVLFISSSIAHSLHYTPFDPDINAASYRTATPHVPDETGQQDPVSKKSMSRNGKPLGRPPKRGRKPGELPVGKLVEQVANAEDDNNETVSGDVPAEGPSPKLNLAVNRELGALTEATAGESGLQENAAFAETKSFEILDGAPDAMSGSNPTDETLGKKGVVESLPDHDSATRPKRTRKCTWKVTGVNDGPQKLPVFSPGDQLASVLPPTDEHSSKTRDKNPWDTSTHNAETQPPEKQPTSISDTVASAEMTPSRLGMNVMQQFTGGAGVLSQVEGNIAPAPLIGQAETFTHQEVGTEDVRIDPENSLANEVGSVIQFTENNDVCAMCGETGLLLCCDGCPKAYHQACSSDLTGSNEVGERWFCNECQPPASEMNVSPVPPAQQPKETETQVPQTNVIDQASEPAAQSGDESNVAETPIVHETSTNKESKDRPRTDRTMNRTQRSSTSMATKQQKGREASKHYRDFVIQLLQMCSGVAPNHPSIFRRAMKAKCLEAHVDGDPTSKQIKAALKALRDTGKVKQMSFAFSRSGKMETRTIVALPRVTVTDAHFLALQEKLKVVPMEEEYMPPEMTAEMQRKPIIGPPPVQDLVAESDPKPESHKRKRTASFSQTSELSASEPARRRQRTSTEPESTANVGFLTLKVPGLGKLKLDDAFASHYYHLPAIPIVFDPIIPPNTNFQASPALANVRRHNASVRQGMTNNADQTKIRWRTKPLAPVPKTLREILDRKRAELPPRTAGDEDSKLAQFEREVDSVLEWEYETLSNLESQKPGRWHFINHFKDNDELEDQQGPIDCDFRHVRFLDDQQVVEKEVRHTQSWKPFQEALHATAIKAAATQRRKTKRQRQDDERDESFVPGELGKRLYKRRKLARAPEGARPTMDEDATATDTQGQRKQRNQLLRNVSDEEILKICVVVICVRTLAGGMEKFIHWPLVARLLPGQEEHAIKQKWRTIAAKFRTDIYALTESFQDRYVDAMMAREVPVVDFDDLDGTDWEAIVQWASTCLDKTFRPRLDDLPATRAEFLEINNVVLEERHDVRELYSYNSNLNKPVKEVAICQVPFGVPVNFKPAKPVPMLRHVSTTGTQEADLDLLRAKSWIFAAILTPADSFKPAETHNKLRRLAASPNQCEKLIEKGLLALQRDKIIARRGGSKAFPKLEEVGVGKTWDTSAKFFETFQFRRLITATMLRQATQYKVEVLDQSFSQGKPVTVEKDWAPDDGCMVALLNLFSAGKVSLSTGDDVPASRYGLEWEANGYQTRAMDKCSVGFSVVAQATSTYTYGDEFETKRNTTCVPRGPMDDADGMGRIPAWFDINGKLRADFWEMYLGAVIGLISCRPGVSTLEIVRSLSPGICSPDIKLIVEFLLGLGVIKQTHLGWETVEWWWLVIGQGVQKGEIWRTEP